MKEWNIFLLSIGGILIMMSYLMPNPILLIVSGCVICLYAIIRLKDSK